VLARVKTLEECGSEEDPELEEEACAGSVGCRTSCDISGTVAVSPDVDVVGSRRAIVVVAGCVGVEDV